MGNSVNLTFSHFEMEDHYGTGNCSYDFLEVTEAGERPLWRGCGEEVPATISSSEDTVRVRFQSDYSVAHNGFRLGRNLLDFSRLNSFIIKSSVHSGQAGGQKSWETKTPKGVRQVEQMVGLL